ncbi:MAG: hypothetical protein AAFZ15_19820 [Bacteroidota bacterium]
MKNSCFFGFLILLFSLFAITAQAQPGPLDSLELSGQIDENAVAYSIKNTATSTVTLDIIIYQDNVLELHNQSHTIVPGQTLVITKTVTSANNYCFELLVSDANDSSSGQRSLGLEGSNCKP